MPYTNEHSARLQDPKKFDPKAYSRTHGGTIYGSKKVPATIDIVWGKLKTHNKPDDKPIPQSLRFPTKNWTAAKAKKWLKDNNIKYILFEPASKKKEKQSEDENRNTAPKNACIFEQDCCEVSFAEDKQQIDDNRFSIIGYSGGIIPNHWFWGNIAFDLQGTRFDKKKTAVLEEHFSTNRIGFTTKQEIKDNVRVEGKFLNNPKAQELRSDIKDGFPMQASLFIQPELIEHVKDGEKAKVNGLTLKGPGTVFRKARIREVSMCSLGADSHTQSKTFADGGKEEIKFNLLGKDTDMAEQTTIEALDAAQLAADYPELFEEVTAKARDDGIEQGRNETMERFGEIKKLAPDDPAFVVEQLEKGNSVEVVKTALIERLRKQKAKPAETAQAEKKAVDPAVAEFSDDASKQQQKEPEKPKTDEEKFTEEFNKDEKLRAEFGGAEGLKGYIAFRKAEEKGLVSIAGRR